MERVPPAPPPAAVCALAERLPAHVRLGTSSWAYPGWRGIVFGARAPAAALARDGLAAYAAWPLFGTVGLDRSFYATPSVAEYAALGSLVPPGFLFTVKGDQRCTRPDMDASGSTLGSTTALQGRGIANPLFLDAGFIRDAVLAPAVEGLGALLGPVVLQFPHLDLSARGRLGGADAFLERLAECLAALRGLQCAGAPLTLAVEVRNRELLRGAHARAYVAALREAEAVHCHVQHPTMPGVTDQERALTEAGGGIARARAVVVRWMLPAGTTYEAAAEALEPYDRLQAPDDAVRSEVAALLRQASPARPGFAVINNKAEGSAALSVTALAAELAG
jgi:uncharacterized protein YecE (DUF72 family)